jgi:hypothetical protein
MNKKIKWTAGIYFQGTLHHPIGGVGGKETKRKEKDFKCHFCDLQ